MHAGSPVPMAPARSARRGRWGRRCGVPTGAAGGAGAAARPRVVPFLPLSEGFVVRTLEDEGVDAERAILAARLTGGNLGRARRLAKAGEGLAFRDVGRQALTWALEGPSGALAAADLVLDAARAYRTDLKDRLEEDLTPFRDERGRDEEAYRGAIARLKLRHDRLVRRAERDYVDWVLLATSSLLRDRVVAAVGGGPELGLNLDVHPPPALPVRAAAGALGAVEEARAALAEELNLNPRLVLGRAL